MAAMHLIAARVSPETKAKFHALAERQQVTESVLLKQLVDSVTRNVGESDVDVLRSPHRRSRDSRLCVRLHTDDHDPYLITAYKAGYDLLEYPLTMAESRAKVALSMRRGGIEMRVVDAVTGAALERVAILERRGSHDGVSLDIPLDLAGVGQIPSSFAGRSVVISHVAYEDATVRPQSAGTIASTLGSSKKRWLIRAASAETSVTSGP